MRRRADWMNKATDPVLELLRDAGLALPPGAIVYNLDRHTNATVSDSSVTRTLDDLRTHGLIRKPPGSKTYYEITGAGERYLDGDLDASELPRSEG